MESLHPELHTRVPSGKWLPLTVQLRGDVHKHCTTTQFKMVMARHVQRCCAWSDAVWSYDQQELHPPLLPTDKNPIKQFHQRTFGENMYFKACAPSSPFFGQRLKLSSAPELHSASFHWLKGRLAQGPLLETDTRGAATNFQQPQRHGPWPFHLRLPTRLQWEDSGGFQVLHEDD